MFRIVRDPSSGSIELYLTEIHSGSLMFFVYLVGVWQRNFEPLVCVYGTTGRELVPSPSDRKHIQVVQNYAAKHTTNISEPLQISVKYSSILPDDGSHTIRNILV